MATFEILLASDFTARSDRPTARAVQLAGEKGGKLVIAHVLEKDAGAEEAVADRLRADLPTDAEDAELVIRRGRSEEHTSELQSLMRISYAVFCLKQKKQLILLTYTL